MGLDVKRGRAWTALAAMVLAGLPACATSENTEGDEPNAAFMVVEMDGTEYTATKANNGFSGVIAEVDAGNVPVVVRFLRQGGANETIITPDDFEFRVAGNNGGAPLPAPLGFERSGAFTGTLSGLAEGQEIDIYFSLFHKTELHTDFGPYFLRITWPLPDDGGGPPQN